MLVEGIRSATSYQPAAITSAPAPVEPAPSEAPRSVQLPYLSPVLSYDSDAAIAVLMFRNSESGDVEAQYPSERVVREYQLRGRDKMAVDAAPAGVRGRDGSSGPSADNSNGVAARTSATATTAGNGAPALATPTAGGTSPSAGGAASAAVNVVA